MVKLFSLAVLAALLTVGVYSQATCPLPEPSASFRYPEQLPTNKTTSPSSPPVAPGPGATPGTNGPPPGKATPPAPTGPGLAPTSPATGPGPATPGPAPPVYGPAPSPAPANPPPGPSGGAPYPPLPPGVSALYGPKPGPKPQLYYWPNGSLVPANPNGGYNAPPAAPTPSTPQYPPECPTGLNFTDVDILNFALNLECLEAEFYSWAAYGHGLSAARLGGGPGSIGGQKAQLSATAQKLAEELAKEEGKHVDFLRTALGP